MIPVYVDPGDPSEPRLVDFRSLWLKPISVGATAFLMLLVAAASWAQIRCDRRNSLKVAEARRHANSP